jgi:DNA polymerase (family 10)
MPKGSRTLCWRISRGHRIWASWWSPAATGKETVGDLDILATSAAPREIMQRFVDFGDVEQVIAHGTTRSSIRLRSGLQVDLRVVPEVSFGAALNYFTGSKAHNIKLRAMGQAKGLKISEYGVFRGRRRIAGKSEPEVYATLKLPYIEPELREDHGEIEAAGRHQLPDLIRREHIRGDLHAHSTASDGRFSIEDMAKAARERGYAYLAITDHSQHLTVARGLDAKRLARQIDQIDRLNEQLEGITILKSTEVDILEDGRLDLPNAILRRLDLRVCSVHYKFELSRDRQTERIIRAMDNPNFNILAHPTGRLLEKRPGYDVDMEKIMAAALERGCHLELNAHPDRLDLDDVHCQMAKQMGLKVAISTDAHGLRDLELMRFGIDQARRGWLEPDDVLNTRPLAELRVLLRRA